MDSESGIQPIERSVSDSGAIGRFPCSYCSIVLSSTSNRSRHHRRFHQEELARQKADEVAFECIICSNGFPTADLLRNHVRQCAIQCQSPTRGNSRIGSSSQSVRSNPSIATTSVGLSEVQSSSILNLNINSSSSSSYSSSNAVSSTQLIPYGSHSVSFDLTIPVIDDTTFNQVFAPLMTWLAAAPNTELERLVKQRRVITADQQMPIRNSLKFIVQILLQHRLLNKPNDLKLGQFAQLNIVQCIHNHLTVNDVKHERIYQIMLLVKKITVYLVSIMSAQSGVYLVPQNAIPSYIYIDEVCRESSQLRKEHQLNRAAGITTRRSHSQSSNSAACVSTASNPSKVSRVDLTPGATTLVNPRESPAAASASTFRTSPIALHNSNSDASPASVGNDIPTKEELSLLAKSCVAKLKSIMTNSHRLQQKNIPMEFAAALVVAIFTLMPTPRTQIVRSLVIGLSQPSLPVNIIVPQQTLFRVNDRWEIRIPSQGSKNRLPVVLIVNEILTAALDFHIQTVRTLLIAPTSIDRGYCFPSRAGGPKESFISWTANVTQNVIGRPINPHSFRSACVSMIYEESGSNSERDMINLASLMAHDPTTARKFYYKRSCEKESSKMNQQLNVLLLGATTAVATDPPPVSQSTDSIDSSSSMMTFTQIENDSMPAVSTELPSEYSIPVPALPQSQDVFDFEFWSPKQ